MADPNYEGIYDVVRGKLRKSLEELPSSDFSMREDAGIVVPIILGKIQSSGVPGSYGALTAEQKTLFDGAVGRIVAARIRPEIMAGENEGKGTVVEKEVGDVRTRYAGAVSSRASGSVGGKSLEEQWIDQANEILASLCKQTRPRRPGAGSYFATPGHRRAEEVASGYRAIDVRELLLPPYGANGRRNR